MTDPVVAIDEGSPWIASILQCPVCGSKFPSPDGFSCTSCEFGSADGRDLRFKNPLQRVIRFAVGGGPSINEFLLQIDTTRPSITYAGPKALRDSAELMSEVAARVPGGGTALDLGCGARDQAPCLEHLGFRYVGVDFDSAGADYLADAHALPFADSSFNCVFSYAVLEHLSNPFVAIQEVARVLKPGGLFIGTVSQGEPFHNSYFHHTPWGLLSVLNGAPSLKTVRMWAAQDSLTSLASMGRYPRVVRQLLRIVSGIHKGMPWLAPRKITWRHKERELDQLYRAGAICFAVQKLTSASDSEAE